MMNTEIEAQMCRSSVPRSQSPPSSSSCIKSHSSVLASLNSSSQQNLNVDLQSTNARDISFCIIGITDTLFDEISVVALDGYQIFRKDRTGNKSAGGVCLYNKSNVEAFSSLVLYSDFIAMSEDLTNNVLQKALTLGVDRISTPIFATLSVKPQLFVNRWRVRPLNSKTPWCNYEIASSRRVAQKEQHCNA
ncbi:hypothetical protein BpHYR1_045440 [Brachionus plicatilis]|uniref:Uncharacterized protein n=1 Tax=Brachionus plicatilis TaxID=10195 RepID=A0A3M7PGX6_BRAPC|nr:hypothetical protein BpHYR1_045440 [Brachionus plicatilis]